jgi:hypothetical protein
MQEILELVEETIKNAAEGKEVVLIKLEIGKDVTFDKKEFALLLYKKFPKASIIIKKSKIHDSVVVKEIEVL